MSPDIQSDDERIEDGARKSRFWHCCSTGRNRNIEKHELLAPRRYVFYRCRLISPEDRNFVSYFMMFKNDIDKAFNTAKVRRLTRYGAIIGMVGAGLGVSIIDSGFGAGSFDPQVHNYTI